MYGYQIVKEVDERSSGYFAFKEGTLYPALHRLEKAKLIEGRWEDTPNNVRRRYYRISAKGQEALADRLSEWQRFTNAMDSIMHPGASPEAQ
jgi:PadR family transcriptional regulator PadR